jgi:hypothetical protein
VYVISSLPFVFCVVAGLLSACLVIFAKWILAAVFQSEENLVRMISR